MWLLELVHVLVATSLYVVVLTSLSAVVLYVLLLRWVRMVVS